MLGTHIQKDVYRLQIAFVKKSEVYPGAIVRVLCRLSVHAFVVLYQPV